MTARETKADKRVERLVEGASPDATCRACLELWNRVWPSADFDVERRLDRWRQRKGSAPGRLHLAWSADGQLGGLCRSFPRLIRFLETGEALEALALAGVASHPGLRGRGYGAAVVADAFSLIGEGAYPLSLFQTGIPEFYARKFGARIVGNRFVNCRSETDPEANPWWDSEIMIYPADATWREGCVDLGGPAY